MSESGLKDEIQSQMHQAMKSRDKVRLGALRLLTAAIKNREIEVRHELDDDEVREIAGKEVKKRLEAIEAFDSAGRTELADKERQERDVVAVYAPAQLSDDTIDALIDEALAATGATSPKEMGKVMGFVMGKAKGQVDGTVVRQKVLARLSEG
ncbi:MAG: GatB/YqeY domain-containing protein [Actinomycetota bacterium]